MRNKLFRGCSLRELSILIPFFFIPVFSNHYYYYYYYCYCKKKKQVNWSFMCRHQSKKWKKLYSYLLLLFLLIYCHINVRTYWNCRGLTRASAICSLKGKLRHHSHDILFLFETKTQTAHAIVILNSLGFFLMSHAPPTGSQGRLLLTWRHGVDLECFSISDNTIYTLCYSDPPNKPWLLTCLYGPPEWKNKPAFWESLLHEGNNYYGPWLCIGDFNMILSQSEKYGGTLFACSSTDPFRHFLDSFGMVDLGFVGNPFTWSNKRQNHHLIKERLVRGITNSH